MSRYIKSALILLSFCLLNQTWSAPKQPKKAKLGEKAPNFVLRDHNGKKVRLSDFKGRIIILEWTNPDCPFVKLHDKFGTMKKLYDKYQKRNIAWLAINSTFYMKPKHNKKRVKERNLPYPILDDSNGTVGKLYGAKTTPHMFIIDWMGRLVYTGAVDKSGWRSEQPSSVNHIDQALSQMLKAKKISVPRTVPVGCSVKYKKKRG